MADKGIIFSAPMVRALLDGRKTQTRRLIRDMPSMPALDNCKHEPRHVAPYLDAYCGERKTAANPRGMSDRWGWWTRDDRPGPLFRVTAAPGDRLYVRENWQALSHGDYLPTKSSISDVRYAATDPLADADKDVRGYPWRPCIHMPRWASRLWLAVTDVRVQRLQDCSEADAIAEGIERVDDPRGIAWKSYEALPNGEPHPHASVPNASPLTSYAELWNSLHTAEGERWQDNPWVVAISFDVHRSNIDAGGPA